MHFTSEAAVARSIRVRLEPDGIHFDCAEGQTLLSAALSSGIDLPYECASGSCGACRARLVEGSVAARWPAATGLSERDRRKGDRILCCQSLPQTDCVIQLRPGSRPVPLPPTSMASRVRTLRALNDDVLHLVLDADRSVRFLPGQFMLVECPDDIGRRAYSMANLAGDTGRLEFLIKRKPGGFASGHLFECVKEGDALRLEGPYGCAWLREDSDRDVVLLAGGSGLAPVWSIALRATAVCPHKRLRLFFGVNRAADLFWLDEIERARRAHPQLDVIMVLMQESAQDPPGCRYGNPIDVMIEEVTDLAQADLYLAGPQGLVDKVMRDVVASGRAQADRVFFDRFG